MPLTLLNKKKQGENEEKRPWTEVKEFFFTSKAV